MSKSPVFALPVQAHVRQFLLKELGPEPVNIHQNTYMGRTVRMKVEKLPFRQLDRPVPAQGPVLLISLPTALRHHTLTPASAKQIGETLDKFFQQQLIAFVKGQVAVTQNERAALRSFYNLYEINPSDYDLEEARKVYRDYRDKIMKGNKHYELMYENGGSALRSDYAVAS
ncbi:hypothetical protein I2I05_18960 [Hymenobacter sp. BT683]|uniref:Uncharacterized protein n=1 Tax=Hymenobacter jeongseonensis TaxID=2791027 RepID=A0ABS0IMB1_9BACT|nr:hypothetical protein [Hymenobacter jeongseonensis]MBF9239481.1 hypothetical protein [Hymenobacter jeongseonensis]